MKLGKQGGRIWEELGMCIYNKKIYKILKKMKRNIIFKSSLENINNDNSGSSGNGSDGGGANGGPRPTLS